MEKSWPFKRWIEIEGDGGWRRMQCFAILTLFYRVGIPQEFRVSAPVSRNWIVQKNFEGLAKGSSNYELINVRAALTCQEHVQQERNCDQNHQNFEVFTNVGERGT